MPVEGHVNIRTQILHDWHPPARRSLSVNKTGSRLQVDSKSEEHFYVTFRREDRHFSDQPPESSVSFQPGYALRVDLDVTSSNSMSVLYFVIEYTSAGRNTYSYTSPSFMHDVSLDTRHVTLAVRAKGRGRLTLGAVSTEIYQPACGWSTSAEVQAGDSVTLRLSAFALEQGQEAAALVLATFKDSRGVVVLPLDGSAINPRLGAYKYVQYGSRDSPAETVYELDVPVNASTADFRIIPWKKGKIYLAEPPVVTNGHSKVSDEVESVADFVESIPVGDTLVVLYTTAPQLGHPTLALRPNRLTDEYLKRGYWVIFFPFSRVPAGQERYTDRARQYSRERISEFLSAACGRAGKNNVFICSSFPDVVAIGAVDLLSMYDWSTVYEVRDDMEEFNRVGYSKWFNPILETRVARSVDKVVTVSPRLADKMDIIRGSLGASNVVPNGVNSDFIDSTQGNRAVDSYRRRSSSTTVGYIGHLTPSWFDWSLLISTAENMPQVSFEIIGHGFPDGLELPANLHYLGAKTHAEFREIAMGWKVGLIPFKPSTLTFAVDPNKIYEYLAVGLRTVTARMGSVHLCPSTWIYDDAEGFRIAIERALSEPFSAAEAETIEHYLATATWSERAESMMTIMRGEDV